MSEHEGRESWDSLAPVPVEADPRQRPAGGQDANRWPPLVGVGVVLLWASFAWFTGASGEAGYGGAGQQLQELESAHVAGFWSCALPGAGTLDDHERVAMAIHTHAAADPKGLTERVERDCMHHLYALSAQLGGIDAPAGIESQLHKMRSATHRLRVAWQTYLEGLRNDDADADAGAISRAFYIYQAEQRSAHRIIRAKTN